MDRLVDYSADFLNASKKIVYGIDEWSKYIFFTAMKDCVSIDGFLVDDTERINRFLGKEVYKVNSYSKEKLAGAEIFDVFGHNIQKLGQYGIAAHPLLQMKKHKDLVLYGAGKYGIFCRALLRELGVESVLYFCDQDEEKQGTWIDGLEVISPQTLSTMRENVDVVISVDPFFAEQVMTELTDTELIKTCWYQPIRQEICIGNQIGIEMTGINYLQRRSPYLRLIGEKNEIVEVARQLKNIDISIISAIDTQGFVGTEKSVRFIDKYETAYDELEQEIIYIGLPDKKGETLRIAKELGIDHRLAGLSRYKYERKYQWDPNIGYVKRTPIMKYGTGTKDRVRIGILGGSTSDEAFCAEKTWVEYFAELLEEQKIPAEIINASVMGYGSAQELIRLCRDLMPLRPHIVISYSGINDVNEQLLEKSRFVNIYQNDVFSAIDRMGYRTLNGRVMEGVYCGTENSDSVNSWINHERMMHSICEEFGIHFWGIAQPSLYALIGENKRHEADALNMKRIITIDNPVKKIRLNQIYEAVQRMKEDWLIDFSDVFEECEAYPFMDGSHLMREGNQFLAKQMYQVMEKTILEILE